MDTAFVQANKRRKKKKKKLVKRKTKLPVTLEENDEAGVSSSNEFEDVEIADNQAEVDAYLDAPVSKLSNNLF